MIEPLHRGFVFTTPMQINLVDDGMAPRLAYDAAKFIFAGVNLNARADEISIFPAFASCTARTPGRIFRNWRFSRARASSARWRRGSRRASGARPVDSHRRCARRGIPGFPRGMDRKGHPRLQCPDHHALLEFRKHRRRLSLHHSSGRRDHHRHRMLAVPAREHRSFRPRER